MVRTLPLALLGICLSLPLPAEVPDYVPTAELRGKLSTIGSDSLNNLMSFWSERFRELHPEVIVEIEGKGSSTAPPALIEGTAQLGPMSREMKSSEIDAFFAVHGYPPTAIPVAIDALAVFVHHSNPIESVSLSDLDSLFSSTRLRGGRSIESWGEIIPEAPWIGRPVSLYGRNSVSGTYGFFKEVALHHGDYRDSVKEQPGSSGVVQSVSTDPYGIGYSGIGYRTSGVRALPIQMREHSPAIPPAREYCLDGTYPLARFLLIYINRSPDRPINPLTRSFLRFALSAEGQAAVERAGYYRLPEAYIERLLSQLALEEFATAQ